jgi:hypothetical protein
VIPAIGRFGHARVHVLHFAAEPEAVEINGHVRVITSSCRSR